MNTEIYNRIMRFAGKTRNQVSNPCLTANEAIELANDIAKMEVQRDELLAALKGMLYLDEANHQRYPGDDDICAEVQAAREAIAKAVQP